MSGLLTGRRALVTGAGAGIGRALALRLARDGADICVLDVNLTAAEAVAREVESLGRTAIAFAADTGAADVVSALELLQTRCGPFDLAVNNAGISPKGLDGLKRMVWETSTEEWQRVMAVNVSGYFHVMRALLPGMVQRRSGSIVNIGSLAGERYSTIAGAAYATAKNAVGGLTRQVAGEVAQFGIRVNCIAPGRIETEMAAVAGGAFNEQIRASTPLGRLGTPDDIASTAAFLLSDAASFITGQTLVVAGGRGL